MINLDAPLVEHRQVMPEARTGGDLYFEVECREVGNDEGYAQSAYNSFMFSDAFALLGYQVDKKGNRYLLPARVRQSSTVVVVSEPKHGTLVQTAEDKEVFMVSYRAHSGYVGMDRFVVSFHTFTRTHKPVRITKTFNVAVVLNITNEQLPSACVTHKFDAV